MPTPPATCSAPVVVLLVAAVLDSVKVFWNAGAPVPLLTNTCPVVPVDINDVVPVEL